MLVGLAKDLRQDAVDRVLPEATRGPNQGVQHRQQQGRHQGESDKPAPELICAEDRIDVAEEDDVGIARAERGEAGGAQHSQQHQGQRDVDEETEESFGGHRDLGVACRLAAFADVAGRCLHRPDGPDEDEGPADDQLPTTGHSIGEGAELDATKVDGRGLEERQDDDQHQWHDRANAKDRREGGAEANAEPAGDKDDEQNHSGGDDHADRPGRTELVGDRTVGAAERNAEEVRDVQRGQVGVDRRDGKPAEPVGPRAESTNVLSDSSAERLEGLERVAW